MLAESDQICILDTSYALSINSTSRFRRPYSETPYAPRTLLGLCEQGVGTVGQIRRGACHSQRGGWIEARATEGAL